MSIKFNGQARPLTPGGLRFAASLIDVSARALRAVIEVETSGHGFDRTGRLRMLFEPVQFYKRTSGRAQASGITLGIAKPNSKGWSYPVDSYPSLTAAMRIDETAALESCSWGLGQIMGFNHEAAGYPSSAAMIAAFVDSEDAHVLGMVRFIRHAGLDKALRAEKWAAFAAGYNGVAYARNEYDTKLSKAYAEIPDDVVPLSVAAVAAVKAASAISTTAAAALPGSTAAAVPSASKPVPPTLPGRTGQGPVPSFWSRLAHDVGDLFTRHA